MFQKSTILPGYMVTNAALLTPPKPETSVRAANCCRQARCLPEPTGLEFIINVWSIPENFLCRSWNLQRKTCYLSNRGTAGKLDGSFKLCCPPLSKLFSISAFVQQGDYARQVLLLFVLMSSRRKHIYSSNHLYVFFFYIKAIRKQDSDVLVNCSS